MSKASGVAKPSFFANSGPPVTGVGEETPESGELRGRPDLNHIHSLSVLSASGSNSCKFTTVGPNLLDNP